MVIYYVITEQICVRLMSNINTKYVNKICEMPQRIVIDMTLR